MSCLLKAFAAPLRLWWVKIAVAANFALFGPGFAQLPGATPSPTPTLQNVSTPVAEVPLQIGGPGVEDSPDYIVDSWNVDDGLPRNGVFSIAQTPDGYLWMGTEAGVARFDGARFKVFSPHGATNMIPGKIAAMLVDRSGQLWLGSRGGGVARYADGHFTQVKTTPGAERNVYSFCEDPAGRIWVGTEKGLQFVENDALKLFEGAAGMNGITYQVAVAPGSGDLIWCSWEDVYYWRDQRRRRLLDAQGRAVASNNFYPGRKPGLWFLDADEAHYGALRHLEPGKPVGERRALPFSVPRWAIGSFLEDSSGNLWIAVTGGGLHRISPDGAHKLLEIGSKDIRKLFEDRQGSIWAGTENAGLIRLKPRLIHVYPEKEPAPIGTVCVDGKGAVVFTTQQGDVYRVQGRNLARLPLKAPYGLLVDRADNYWASQHGALTKNVPTKDGFEVAKSFLNPPYHGAHAFLQASDDTLWFGSLLSGIARFNEAEGARVVNSSSDDVRAIAEGKDGAIWLGNAKSGLQLLENGSFTTCGTASGLPGTPISALLADSHDMVWIGTLGGGLVRFKDGAMHPITMRNGLPSDEVCAMLEVDKDLWLGTTKGVVRAPKQQFEEVAAGVRTTLDAQVFGVRDGMISAECSTGFHPSACRGPDGRLWFATIAGLAVIDPALAPRQGGEAPPVYIEEILADDAPQNFAPGETLAIPAGAGRIEARYTGIDLAAPRRVRFQYQLQGHDEGWIDSWDRRAAYFTKVPPGSYRLLVRAAGPSGSWSAAPAELGLRILPFYWQTLWFKCLAVTLAWGLGAAAIWLGFHLKYRARFEFLARQRAIERERTRIAMDLHDQLGAHATQITFHSSALSEQIRGGQAGENPPLAAVERIQRAADHLVRGMDEVVWAANPAKDTVESAVAFITSYAEDYFKSGGTRLRIDVPLQLEYLPLGAEARHELFLAVREALANVMKHAAAGEAWLRMRRENRGLCVTIEDNGKGLPEDHQALEGNGLRNMRKRMERAGGHARFLAGEPAGTRIELWIPLESLSPENIA